MKDGMADVEDLPFTARPRCCSETADITQCHVHQLSRR